MSQRTHSTSISPGEAAVDGLLNGLLAGLAMLAFLLVAGLLAGGPTLQTLQAFGWERGGAPFAGAITRRPGNARTRLPALPQWSVWICVRSSASIRPSE